MEQLVGNEAHIIMQITIDIDSATPIFAQLVEQIKRAAGSEAISPGDPLPSIRQLANDLDVNSKTVSKAYKLLERDGVIQSKGYRGTFVHPDAKQNCQLDISRWVADELQSTIERLRGGGATDSEIRIAFSQMMGQPDRV